MTPIPVTVRYAAANCFPVGSKVLMGDRTWKNIEEIVLTDMVMGVNGPEGIVKIERPQLGSRRMLRFADSSLRWSEDHAMWVKRNNTQWWWTANPALWKSGVMLGTMGGLKDNDSMLGGFGNLEWAHTEGWRANRVVVEDNVSYDTQLYLPFTSGSPIIVQGYVVGAGVNEEEFDYTEFDWDKSRATILATK